MWIHLAFKVKYCHKIFDIPEIKDSCEAFLNEAMSQLDVSCREMGFDRDHVHFVIDIGITPVDVVVKALKGYTAKQLLRKHSWLKRQYFWKSGMWNPSYFYDSLGRDVEELSRYVKRQGIPKDQRKINLFLTN
jgi:REP element-mobilizing transposase RayT